jgi:hypothetical protein
MLFMDYMLYNLFFNSMNDPQDSFIQERRLFKVIFMGCVLYSKILN